MKVSQLLHVIDKDDTIVIEDFEKPVTKMQIYVGPVRGIKKDNPINKMHVAGITAVNDTLFILAEDPKMKGEGHENRKYNRKRKYQK